MLLEAPARRSAQRTHAPPSEQNADYTADQWEVLGGWNQRPIGGKAVAGRQVRSGGGGMGAHAPPATGIVQGWRWYRRVGPGLRRCQSPHKQKASHVVDGVETGKYTEGPGCSWILI